MAKEEPIKDVIATPLKFKGGPPAGVKKHKKKKKHTKKDTEHAEKMLHQANKESEAETEAKDDKDETKRPQSEHKPWQTEAEKRFDELRRKRLLERAEREGAKSHRERVEEFNQKLARQTEHNDMPKIGPG